MGFSRYDRAGTRANRSYKALRHGWRRRVFGRAPTYVWLIVIACVLTLPHLQGPPQVLVTAVGAGLVVGWLLVSDAPPDHIARWRRGAWGEQETARQLRPLKKLGWVVRHDIQLPHSNGNLDHVVVGPAVYLLDSKALPDELTLEGSALRVRRIDAPRESYLIDHLTAWMKRSAKALSWAIHASTGERVFVHPVVVLWGHFGAGAQEADGVYYVAGNQVADWLQAQPTILNERRRTAVAQWLREWTPEDARAQGAVNVSSRRLLILPRGRQARNVKH